MPKEPNDWDLDDFERAIERRERELNRPDEPCSDDEPLKEVTLTRV